MDAATALVADLGDGRERLKKVAAAGHISVPVPQVPRCIPMVLPHTSFPMALPCTNTHTDTHILQDGITSACKPSSTGSRHWQKSFSLHRVSF